MVPARFISEAFAFDVSWNQLYREVSVMDIDSLKEGIDTDYTLVDNLLTMSSTADLSKNYLVSGDMDISFKNNDVDIKFNTKMDAITGANMSSISYDMESSVDLGSLDAELRVLIETMFEDEAQRNLSLALLENIKEFNIQYIVNIETLEFYVKCDLSELFGKVILGTDALNGNPWIKISYKDLLPEDQYNLLISQMDDIKNGTLEANVEYMVDTALQSYSSLSLSFFNYYEYIDTALSYIKDENFIKSGEYYTLSDTIIVDESQQLGINYELKLKTKPNKEVVSYDFNFNVQDEFTSMAFGLSQKNSEHVKMLFDFSYEQLGELLEFKFDFDLTQKITTQQPLEIPTENIINITDPIM